MSVSVYPTLRGLGFDFTRSPLWSTNRIAAVSGKETAIAYWSSPRWQYELVYNFLRDTVAEAELAALRGFFNARQGGFDTFLFQDPDDNSVTAQALGAGTGSRTTFQLLRTMDGIIEPILAPNVITGVYLNGVLANPSTYTVSSWGTSAPGVITFNTAPGSGVAVTATFSYYFPCRFDDDTMDLKKFLYKIWRADSVKFTTVK